jgi:hypothetical protein
MGVFKRFACKPPDAEADLLARLKAFVLLWCCQNLVPLPSDSDLSVDAWLEQTGYSRGRINELKNKWKNCGGVLSPRHFVVKSFVKDESYPEWKHARWINSRTDEFKCAVGPTFKAIEKELFKSSWFIKKIPVKDRPKFIYDNVYRLGSKYVCTDYTAFESHFTRLLFESCEFVLYDFMTQYLPSREEFHYYIHDVIGGRNECFSKLVTVAVQATRMSGEMCTSLGNGFSNLMFFLFLCKLKGCTNIVGVIEGDDGLFAVTGPHPTEDDFKRLGLTIKMQVFDDLAKASFCGLIFDASDLINIADPIKILCQTGFSTQQYVFAKSKILRGLLKAKAFSLAYQYPGCPIICSFSRYLLRVLEDDYVYFRKGNSDYSDFLQKEAYTFWLHHREVLEVDPLPATRLLMENVYGISVSDQYAMETYFDSLTAISIIDNQIVLNYVPLLWKECGAMYIRHAPLDPLIINRFYD